MEAQALQERAQQELQLCKPWLPGQLYRNVGASLVFNRTALCQQASIFPGQTILPAEDRDVGGPLAPVRVACTGCGRWAFQLRKCSGCKAVSYCSRECHVRHWKEGGHKRECAQLAATASSGAAT